MCRFRRQAEPEQSGLCDDEAQGGFAAPSSSIQMGSPADSGPLGEAAKARYEHLTRLAKLYK